ncbi:von Willebrand factor D and EGF domain-containing protein-like [Argopecten irradians]|uniref:von Willebrand factor D and EGF domain-containing protein-like n=1 Tax=Argopecten irradians TaxID=31199 RepID=UPI0037199574
MDNDPMVTKCKDAVSAMNDVTANGIQECIGDIMLSGHDGYMEDTLKAIQKNCLIQAVLFENLTSQGPNGSESTMFDELLEISCPENCSGNGYCKKGECDCQAGFYGDNCARELDTAPEILTGGLTCSIDKRSCKNFVISGNNFLDVSLTCRVRLLKIYASRWEIGSSITFSARYLNDFNCVCSIPDSHRRRRAADDSEEIFAEGYLVSVSNDGNNFSNETNIIAFDSGCYDCDAISMNCTKLESCDQTIATEPTIAEDDALPLAVIIVCVLVTVIGIAVAFTLIKAKLFSTKSRVNQDRPTTSQTLSVIDLEDDSNRMTTAWEKEKCSSKQTLHSNKIDKDTQHPFTPSLSVIGLAKDSNQMTAEREKTKWSREQTFCKEKDTQRPNTASVSVIDLEFNTE